MNMPEKNPQGNIENFDLYAPKLVDKEEYFSYGHRACQGCGEALAVRLMCKALGKDTVIASATGCMEVVSSLYPTTAWKLPWIHVAFPNSAAVGSGVEAGLKVLRRKGKIADRPVKAVAMGGDGGTLDIGFQALSGAMERGVSKQWITGARRASLSTPPKTPAGAGRARKEKKTKKKTPPEIMVAH